MKINPWVLALLVTVPLGVRAQEPPAPQGNKGYVAATAAPEAAKPKEEDRLPTLKELLHGNGSGHGSKTGTGNPIVGLWEGVRKVDDWTQKNLW